MQICKMLDAMVEMYKTKSAFPHRCCSLVFWGKEGGGL